MLTCASEVKAPHQHGSTRDLMYQSRRHIYSPAMHPECVSALPTVQGDGCSRPILIE